MSFESTPKKESNDSSGSVKKAVQLVTMHKFGSNLKQNDWNKTE